MKVFPRSTGRRRILQATTAAGALATAAAAAAALLLDSGAAAASAGFGGGVVLVLSGASLWLIDRTERRAPHRTLAVFMLAFAGKLAVLAVLMSLVSAPGWVEPVWAVVTAAAVVVTVQTVQILTFGRLRLAVEPDAPAEPRE